MDTVLISYLLLLDWYVVLNSNQKQFENVIDTLGTATITFYSTVVLVLLSLLARYSNSGNETPRVIVTTIGHLVHTIVLGILSHSPKPQLTAIDFELAVKIFAV